MLLDQVDEGSKVSKTKKSDDGDNNLLLKIDSKLPPLVGSPQAAKAEYDQKSKYFLSKYEEDDIASLYIDPVQRYFEELLAPTPQGQEPKTVQVVKAITWFSVMVLVLIEIYISVKVGGSPFNIGQVAVPDRPAWSPGDLPSQ